jgi:hypothetical protein
MTRLQAGRSDVQGSIPSGARDFSLSYHVRSALGPTQPPIQWIPGALFLGVKWLGHEADHSPLSSAKVTKEWSYTSIHLYGVMVIITSARDNCTFT